MSYLDKFYNITEPIIGLDIGHSSLKMVQLNRKANPPKLMAYNSASIPPKAMTDHQKTQDHKTQKTYPENSTSAPPQNHSQKQHKPKHDY